MFRLPSDIHGVTAGPGRGYLVHADHAWLRKTCERALVDAQRNLDGLPKPQYSNTTSFYTYNALKMDIYHLERVLDWLRELP